VVQIPLAALAIPRHPAPFVAEAHFHPAAARAAAAASRRVLISGVLFRTPEALSVREWWKSIRSKTLRCRRSNGRDTRSKIVNVASFHMEILGRASW
jgi:hypothetical protein